MRPRAGQVAAAATGRTAGWLVAAALAGSLVTLLLVPGRTSPSGLTVVPSHRVAFVAPGARPGGQLRPGKRVSVHVPPGAKIVTIPGRVQVTLPANGPGKRAFRLRPPALKRIIGKAGRPGGPARRITIHVARPRRLGRLGGLAIAGLAPGCAMVMPGMRYMPAMPFGPAKPGGASSPAPASPPPASPAPASTAKASTAKASPSPAAS